jgi:hypothetical protein
MWGDLRTTDDADSFAALKRESEEKRQMTRDLVAAIDPNRQGGSGERSEPGGRDTDGQAGG